MTAKVALYTAMRRRNIRNVALAKKLNCQENEVRRMLDPRHATKIDTMERPLSAIGIRLITTAKTDPRKAA